MADMWILPLGDEEFEDDDHNAPEEMWGGWSDHHVLELFNDIFSHIHPAVVIQICEAALLNGPSAETINLGFEDDE